LKFLRINNFQPSVLYSKSQNCTKERNQLVFYEKNLETGISGNPLFLEPNPSRNPKNSIPKHTQKKPAKIDLLKSCFIEFISDTEFHVFPSFLFHFIGVLNRVRIHRARKDKSQVYLKDTWGVKKRLTNSRSPAPAPTSAFLSCWPPGARLYCCRSSPPLGPSERAADRVGRASDLVVFFNVDGTISGGKCKYCRKYSMPSFVRYLKYWPD
jgi:hypothetical protein